MFCIFRIAHFEQSTSFFYCIKFIPVKQENFHEFWFVSLFSSNNRWKYTQLNELIFRILYEGEAFMYNHANPVIELGEMFGIFMNQNDYVDIWGVLWWIVTC